MPSPYRHVLAHVHNAGFGHVAHAAAGVLMRELARARMASGLVIDLGCGSGILSEQVVQAGYGVLGIDLSPAMILLARRRVPSGSFRSGSLWTARLPRCIAIAAVGECVNYLFDKKSSKRALLRFFRRAHDALLPGGLLILDAAAPGRVPGGGPVQSHTEGNGWTVQVTAEEDRRRRMLTRHITSFRQRGRLWHRDDEVHRLQLYSPQDVLGNLTKAGFKARAMRKYGELKLPVGWNVFIAARP